MRALFLSAVLIMMSLQAIADQLVAMNTFTRVASSDYIVMGKIDSIVFPDQNTNGEAIVQVDKVLKGNKMSPTIKIENLAWLVGPNVTRFIKDNSYILCLQIFRSGYLLLGGANGVLSTEDEPEITAEIQHQGISISIRRIEQLIIGKSVSIEVLATNKSDKPVGISMVTIHGHFLSPIMESNFDKILIRDPKSPHSVSNDTKMIYPGENYRCILMYTCEQPPSWKTIPPDTYIQCPALCRVSAQLDWTFPRDVKKLSIISSPPISVSVRYPIPTMSIDNK